MPVPITCAKSDQMSDRTTEHLPHYKKKQCLAGCKLSANNRERRHLQLRGIIEVERLQRRQPADRLGQRLQPSLMDPKALSRKSRERDPPKKKKYCKKLSSPPLDSKENFDPPQLIQEFFFEVSKPTMYKIKP